MVHKIYSLKLTFRLLLFGNFENRFFSRKFHSKTLKKLPNFGAGPKILTHCTFYILRFNLPLRTSVLFTRMHVVEYSWWEFVLDANRNSAHFFFNGSWQHHCSFIIKNFISLDVVEVVPKTRQTNQAVL